MPKKPENLELENLSLVQNERDATTPTIRLTLPNVDSNIVTDSNGITNPVFRFDDEDIKRAKDSVSVNIPVSPDASLVVPSPGNKTSQLGSSVSLTGSLDINGLLSPLPNGYSSPVNGHVSPTLKHRTRCNTLAVTDTLGPPSLAHILAVKRHSLPVPGKVDYLTPTSSLLAPTLSNGSVSLSNGDIPNGHKSKSQPSSPVRSRSPWDRLFGGRKQRKSSAISSVSGLSDFSASGSCDGDHASLNSPASTRLRDLVKSVTEHAKKIGKNDVLPVATPEPSTLAPPLPHPPPKRNRLDSFAPSSLAEEIDDLKYVGKGCCKLKLPRFFKKLKIEVRDGVIDASGNLWLTWLHVVAMAFIYNAIVIFLRGVFPSANADNIWIWWMFDYMCDTIYVIDIFLRMRHRFVLHGMYITDKKLLRLHYMSSRHFKIDLLCLLPLDLFYIKTGCYGASAFLRLPRLLKVQAYVEFTERFENKSKSAWLFRVVKTIGYMLYMIHLNTCCYYAISVWEGIASNGWVWNGVGNSYIRCCYRATKTLITIGNLPDPVTTFEIFFMNVDFIIGIFVFATIIGQMRDILGAARATKEAFRRRMDNTMRLLNTWKIPEKAQKRVRMWYLYNWERGELLDEKEVMEAVPIKMQTDLAIHVHMGTLSKVSLFQDCDKMLLRDLVLKLRPVLYLPGDYICTKGEVGKEMYIVNSGIVEVMGGEDGTKVLATLHPGSVFGEISLLAMGGGNRRTADVISSGFANLFVLQKQDLQEAIVNYPEAQESLKRKAKEIMKQNEANKTDKKKKRGKSLIAESILTKRRENTPRMFDAVLQVARSNRLSHSILKGAAKRKNSVFAEYSYHSSTGSDSSLNDCDGQSPANSRPVTRYKRKKKSPDKRKDRKILEHDKKPSSFDSAVIVHTSPKSEYGIENDSDSSVRAKPSRKSGGRKRDRARRGSLDDFDCDSLLNDDKAEFVNEEKRKLVKRKSRDSVLNAISDIMKNTEDTDSLGRPMGARSASANLNRGAGGVAASKSPKGKAHEEPKPKEKKVDPDLDGLSDILNDSLDSDHFKQSATTPAKEPDRSGSLAKSDKTKTAADGHKSAEKIPQKLPPLKPAQAGKNASATGKAKQQSGGAKKKPAAVPHPTRKSSTSKADSGVPPAAKQSQGQPTHSGQSSQASKKATQPTSGKQPVTRKQSTVSRQPSRQTSFSTKPAPKESTQTKQQDAANKADGSQPAKVPSSETKDDKKHYESKKK